MSQQQQNLSSFLEHNLDPITSRYIMGKYLMMDGGEQSLDLRHMCDNVKLEMQLIEKEAAYDYLKVEKEMYELDGEIEKSDAILGELENVLLNFKDYLNDIKSEMTQLQERSVKMNTSLTNRKALSQILSSFVDQAVLDPSLIDNICSKEINDQYVEYIRILCSKLEYLKNTELTDANAVKNLGPELIKLKNTACKRVREFMIDKLNQLKKPKINIQQYQIQELVKYKIFTEFMKDHYLDIYVELCNLYTDAMSKLYLSNMKVYVAEIHKLTIDVYLRNDLIVPDSQQNYRPQLNLRNVVGLTIENRSIFQLMNRDQILQFMDEEPLLHTQLNQKNQKILIEQYFKTINKVLIDTVLHEDRFSQDFFSLKPDQNRLIFSGVFKNTIQFVLDHLKQTVSIFDIYAFLLIILLNERFQKHMHSKNSHVLDFYFEQVNMILWPKFEQVFDTHIQSIQSTNVRLYRSLEKYYGFRSFVMRYIDLTLSLYKLYAYFEDNKMIVSRINQLRLRYFDLIKRTGAEFEIEVDRITYTLSVYEMIVTAYNTAQMTTYKKEFSEETLFLEKETNKFSEKLIEIYLKELFGNLVDFIQKYAKEESELELNLYDNKQQSEIRVVEKVQNLNQVDNKKLIENISQDVNLSWNKRVDVFRLECEKHFQGTNLMKSLLKKFLQTFMAYYNAFYKYAKANHPMYVANLTQVTTIMKEIKAIQTKYNM
ncbi:unnamed protein product [Paramecium octaurelia]|uniref:Uncharacterized protein n=1 Tax=Paramecium octaurelia TaxID=43137 RepID=A0A8S1X004_PAROT|nr:unnamed protein product [Paramecium octaurelia]